MAGTKRQSYHEDPASLERRAQEITDAIDQHGMGISELEDWIEFLEEIQCHCKSYINAAREDIKRRDGEG